jgi:hypothetical protein
MSGAPGRVTRVARFNTSGPRGGQCVVYESSQVRRFAQDVSGAASRPVNEMSPARPGRLLRSGCGLAASRSVLAAVHPSAPKGLPNQPLLRNGKPTDTKRQKPRRCACGASLKPVLHRRSKRREPVAVKAKPCGRCAALTGSALVGLLGARGSCSAQRCATAEPRKPNLFRDAK